MKQLQQKQQTEKQRKQKDNEGILTRNCLVFCVFLEKAQEPKLKEGEDCKIIETTNDESNTFLFCTNVCATTKRYQSVETARGRINNTASDAIK